MLHVFYSNSIQKSLRNCLYFPILLYKLAFESHCPGWRKRKEVGLWVQPKWLSPVTQEPLTVRMPLNFLQTLQQPDPGWMMETHFQIIKLINYAPWETSLLKHRSVHRSVQKIFFVGRNVQRVKHLRKFLRNQRFGPKVCLSRQ